ncbi:catalase family peroxidase [Nocardia sp. NPDC059180]|uniref:catalase family peroxidase n=1 Tax=Nocardia sp. NPDC059180 TaxID=3346761 RepID=UPI0036BBF1BD
MRNSGKVTMDRRTLLGALVVGGAGALSIGGFLFTENIIGPSRLTARAIIDRFQNVNGVFPGFRRNHAKGVAVDGYFESNGHGAELSSASVFRAGKYQLSGRFSLSGGNPHVADSVGIVRGLGLRIQLPAGEQWRLAMINLPVFLDPTPQDFYDRTLAFAVDPATGTPDPETVSEYLATHPRTVAAMAITKSAPPADTFAATTFNSINAFEFTNADGVTVPVRWTLVPETGNPARTAGRGPNYLFDQIVADIEQLPRRWTMMIVVGVPGEDRTDDATIPWPADRRTVVVGSVVLTGISTETSENVRNVNFDPLVLPDGIAPSDDPLLSARSAAYAESFRRRAGETDGRGTVEVGGRA